MADPSTEAQSIYTELAPDSEFPSITVDLDSPDYALPDKTNNPLYVNPVKPTIDELTTGFEGAGSFDEIMASIKAHIIDEFDNNRITGEEYTKAYIELTTAALSSGLSFLLQADTNFYQNSLIQAQARAAEVQAVIAAAQLEEQKQKALLAEFQAKNARATYALTKMQLALTDIQYTEVEKQIEIGERKRLQIEAETAGIAYNTANILPEQKRKLAYETDTLLPANTAKVVYETTHIMPQQKANLEKDVIIKTFQRDSILDQQHKLLKEQTEVQHAQTKDARIDNTGPIVGAIGKQKELYTQQIDSYKKDARYKVGKMYLDAWITQKSLDEGLFAPDQLNNTNVNEVLANLRLDNLLGS